MRSVGRALIQYDQCPSIKGKFGQRDSYRGETVQRHTGRSWPCDWSAAPLNRGWPRTASKHQKLEGARQDPPQGHPRERGSADTSRQLDLGRLASRLGNEALRGVLLHTAATGK